MTVKNGALFQTDQCPSEMTARTGLRFPSCPYLTRVMLLRVWHRITLHTPNLYLVWALSL